MAERPTARPTDDKLWDQTLRERDEAEEALGAMYALVTGRAAEWSNAWGYADALEEAAQALAQRVVPDGYDVFGDKKAGSPITVRGRGKRLLIEFGDSLYPYFRAVIASAPQPDNAATPAPEGKS
jgi:hypothetical protein